MGKRRGGRARISTNQQRTMQHWIAVSASISIAAPSAEGIQRIREIQLQAEGGEVGLLFRCMLVHMPLDRVQDKPPKEITQNKARTFVRTHKKSFEEYMHVFGGVDVANASLLQLLQTLEEWLWLKTSNDHFRQVLCCPLDGTYRMCDFHWEGFYISEAELHSVCIEAVQDYAVARWLGFEALST